MRALYCHSKGADDLSETRNAVTRLLSELMSGTLFEVVLARDDFMANALSAGGWVGWPAEVVERLDENNEPYYDLFIVPRAKVGKGTADVVRAALAADRPVMHLAGGRFRRVSALVEVDPTDFWGGWTLEVEV